MTLRYDIRPAQHLTIGTRGAPGQRIFYLQASDGIETMTLIIEKVQLLSLEKGAEQFLDDLEQRYPEIPAADASYEDGTMALQEPLDPLFRVGNIGLGYDEEDDMIVLLAREFGSGEEEGGDTRTARIWCSRSRLRALCAYGLVVASRGRPICPHCGQPIDPEGHFCPKRNGHKH